jgi:predicted small lipoprotein YifL
MTKPLALLFLALLAACGQTGPLRLPENDATAKPGKKPGTPAVVPSLPGPNGQDVNAAPVLPPAP